MGTFCEKEKFKAEIIKSKGKINFIVIIVGLDRATSYEGLLAFYNLLSDRLEIHQKAVVLSNTIVENRFIPCLALSCLTLLISFSCRCMI